MPRDSVDELIQQLETLRVEEQAILRRLVDARTRETRERNTDADNEARRFRIGDRVRITNQIRNPIGRQANERDRTATVTKLTEKRVFVRTDNGTNTNRSPENLQLLQ